MATSSSQALALQRNSSEQNRFMEKLMTKIFNFYDEKSLIDVTFKFSNPTALVPAHRLILAAASPYFENLFNDNQGTNTVIEINDIDSDIFEHLITFCYTGQVLITGNNVAAMLNAAIFLKLDDAISSIEDYLMAHIHKCSLQGAYTLERKMECLYQKILEYEAQKFMEINRSDEFLNFDVERGVSTTNCGGKTILALFYESNPKLLQYNKTENKWQEYASIKINCDRNRTILKDDNLLFIGGWQSGAISNCVHSWNIRNKTWQNLPGMMQARSLHCVVELDNKIYAIGGYDSPNTLSSVERYTTSDGWRFVNSLIVGRFQAGAVTLNGKIYIMGGYNDCTKLKSVECYNPDSNTWISCADMRSTHTSPNVAVHKGHIYVFSLSGSERYDPQQDTWSEFCYFNIGTCDPAFVSLDNKLWAIGSWCKSADKTRVKVFDEKNYCWLQRFSLPTGENLLESSLPNVEVLNCFVVPESLLSWM